MEGSKRMSYGFLQWFNKEKELTTNDGKKIEVLRFDYKDDKKLMSEWAKYFREIYSKDELLDDFRNGMGFTRSEYLLRIVFPDKSDGFGPATRSGDFAEILVADFLEFFKNYWIPRIRYDDKATRNSSTQGSDIVGIKLKKANESNKDDELIVFEVKAQFSGKKVKNRLQDAVNDSNKDITRVGEFLNYAKRRFIREKKYKERDIIERFQNISDNPYIERFGAAAFFTDTNFDEEMLQQTNCSAHLKNDTLTLLVFTGKDMMTLVHSLYERAADEA